MSDHPTHRHPTLQDNSGTDHIKIIDMDASLKRLGQDRQLQADLVVIFLEDSEVLLERVTAAWNASQPAKLKQTAHCLKGLCANFDAHAAVKAAFAVEEIGAEENWDDAAEAIERLHDKISELRDALRAWQAEQ